MLTWQTTIARLLAAKDAKTGQRVYTATSFFFVCQFLIPGIWGIAALATLGPASCHDRPRRRRPCRLCLAPTRAGRPDGAVGRGHAGGRHVDRFVLHAHLGKRDLNDLLAPFRKTTGPSGAGCSGIA